MLEGRSVDNYVYKVKRCLESPQVSYVSEDKLYPLVIVLVAHPLLFVLVPTEYDYILNVCGQ